MTVRDDVAAVVQIGYDAYNDHSFDAHWLQRAAAVVAEECEVVDVPSGAILHGPEGLKQFLLGFSTAFPDSRVEVSNLVTTEDGAVVEFVGRGTHTGPCIRREAISRQQAGPSNSGPAMCTKSSRGGSSDTPPTMTRSVCYNNLA